MGRYPRPLSMAFAAFLDVAPGQRALGVGCGPGAFVAELVGRLGADAVAAVDPSPTFVAAARSRFPAVDVRTASAEALPFPDDTFDVVGAQLVVHFMDDPARGIAEMARGRTARLNPLRGRLGLRRPAPSGLSVLGRRSPRPREGRGRIRPRRRRA